MVVAAARLLAADEVEMVDAADTEVEEALVVLVLTAAVDRASVLVEADKVRDVVAVARDEVVAATVVDVDAVAVLTAASALLVVVEGGGGGSGPPHPPTYHLCLPCCGAAVE